MPEINTTDDIYNYIDENKPRLSQGLNVLTILTFIGSGIAILWSFVSPLFINFMLKIINSAESDGNMTDEKLADLQKSKPLFELMKQNMVPLLIIGLLGAGACLYGAILMRKLKRDGYWIYIVGQIVPIAGTAFFLGSAQYSDWKSYLGLLIPLIFITLYTFQKKYLVK